MSIQVRSNEVPQQEQKPEAESKLGAQSAPAEQAEQNESLASDTEEAAEKVEATDESEDADDAEDGSDESKDDGKDKPRKKGGFQRRIDKLNARHAEAQRELEYWKQLALKEKAGSEPVKEQPKVERVVPQEGKPDPDQFDTHADYIDALTDWKLEQREKARAAEDNRKQLQTEQQRIIAEHHEREKSFAEKTEGYVEAITELLESNPYISAAVEQLIVTSENGPGLMYELAKNRAEFERINKLPPLAAAMELGRIESRLQKSAEEPKVEAKKITKAPKPLEPIGGSKGAVRKSIDDPNLSQADYERIRREQMKSRGL
jgi:hypothetical protein